MDGAGKLTDAGSKGSARFGGLLGTGRLYLNT
jgi:hypothetical protein